jgi:hypothetical protein
MQHLIRLLRVQVERRLARESIDLRVLESQDQSLNGRVSTQSRHSERTSGIKEMPHIQIPLLGEETAHPSPDAAIVIHDLACYGVKSLARLQGVLLDPVAERDHGREAVGELHEADGCRQAGKAEEVRNRGGEDECDGPVDWDNAGPEDLTTATQK